MTVTNNEIAREFAERLLAIEAVSLSPDARSLGHPGYTRPSTATIG